MTQPQYGYPPQGYQAPPPPQYPPYQQPAPASYGTVPPQGYQQPVYGVPPGQGYPGQPQGMYQSTPPAPPQQDLGGDLDSFYAQRQVGGGKGISWKGVPDGFTIQGVVARQITDGDVFKETHPPNSPQAGQLRTNRDGSFKYAMQVPLKLQWLDALQQQTYPEGEARLFLRGGLRDEMTRAMAEVGAPVGPPEAGAFVRVTLTHRKPGNNIATNVFAVVYRSPGTWENGQVQAPPQTAAPQQAPYQQQAPAQYAAPAQAAPNPQQYPAQQGPQPYGVQTQPAYDPNQYAQPQTPVYTGQAQGAPQYGQQAYEPNPQAQQAPPSAYGAQAPQGLSGQPMQAAPNPQAPGNQGPAPTQPAAQPQYTQEQLPIPGQPPVQAGVQPSALDPGRQALLARLQGQQGQQA